jgi:hypothetical protein
MLSSNGVSGGFLLMAKDPTKDPSFQKTLKSLLNMKPKPHSEMNLGKAKAKKAKSPRKAGVSSKPKSA